MASLVAVQAIHLTYGHGAPYSNRPELPYPRTSSPSLSHQTTASAISTCTTRLWRRLKSWDGPGRLGRASAMPTSLKLTPMPHRAGTLTGERAKPNALSEHATGEHAKSALMVRAQSAGPAASILRSSMGNELRGLLRSTTRYRSAKVKATGRSIPKRAQACLLKLSSYAASARRDDLD